MQLIIHPNAEKVLSRLPVRDSEAIKAKLQIYADTGHGDVKKLSGRDEYRMRIGVWRALFVVQGNMIVLRVAHRREVYR
ncbi:type II toxin-antitoxin system RelE family toxin [Aureimonas glaciei]|uniref:Type II toxin-antitoxin system RelE/ParE family toxin n=1 Tax=Aureimonas glaciei TaxID=1776957 RepID=A0A917D848_9HYPH|nr:type II toxin-antitoxin system RelE/ParE family toxin [Aureimonas glaciei]GGD13913.1 hypothetical protein GCM10011335_15840 [Aureimonas glaciei]